MDSSATGRKGSSRIRPELPAGGVLHCFSGDYESAKKFADLGFRISFAGNLTYPKNGDLHDAAVRLPLDLILLKTDSPYLAPQPVRGCPCSPAHIVYTYAFLAKICGVEVSEITKAVENNILTNFPKMKKSSAPKG